MAHGYRRCRLRIYRILAQIWKIRGKEGEFRGGPAYYIEKALGHRWLGILFAVLLILCYAFGFNGLQAYNACSALEYYVPDYNENGLAMIVGLLLVLMTATVIFGGQKRISVITSIVVPVMALAYIAIALWTTISNIAWLPAAFDGFPFESTLAAVGINPQVQTASDWHENSRSPIAAVHPRTIHL